MRNKFLALLLVLAMCLTLFGCAKTPANETEAPTNATETPTNPDPTTPDPTEPAGDLVILFTNDVHNAYLRNDEKGILGYAALAAYRDRLVAEGKTVILADAGDAIQGEAVGALSKGSYLVDIMNEVGYDFAVPGNHEFDFGMDTFLDLANNRADYQYLSCNFIDLTTNEPVFDAYKIVEQGGKKIAFVGISTPETFTKSTPAYFQNDAGEYIYSFAEGNDGQDLYDCVQKAIDAAYAEGADYVLAIGHMGIDTNSEPWTSSEIIANTTGLTAFLDGHSHSTINGETVADKDGNDVLRCSTGTKFSAIGEVTLNLDTGACESVLVTTQDLDNEDVLAFCENIAAEFEGLLSEVVAKSEVELVVADPATGERMVRSQETNLGDLCADAYRSLLGADIGFVNGGGVRDAIAAGDVTYGNIIAVHPFGNLACLVEVSGQQILDALELAYRDVGTAECGGFLQVSGLTCTINTAIPSSVKLDDKGCFIAVEGERRVSDVKVGGEPIDPEKTYTLASHNYMLKDGGDGFTMFIGSNVLKDEVMVDNEVLINYIQETLGGVVTEEQYGNPYGEGRITIQ